jgi:BASS family bile acid:Na+ symporter
VAWNLFFLIGIPMTAAFIVRKVYPKLKELAPKLSNFSFLLWLTMLFLTASSASAYIRGSSVSPVILLEIAGLSAAICAVNFTLGYFLAGREFKRESSQSLGQKNTMFTLSLAMTFSGPLAALGPTFYVLWHNLWNAAQMFFHDRRKNADPACENANPGYIDKQNNEPRKD